MVTAGFATWQVASKLRHTAMYVGRTCIKPKSENIASKMFHKHQRRRTGCRTGLKTCAWSMQTSSVCHSFIPEVFRDCTQQQLIFPPQFEYGPARLRTFMNQPDIFGVASFVAKCLALFPWCIFLAFFGLVTGYFPSFRSDSHQRHI